MKPTVEPVIPARGYVRDTVSGCIVHTSEARAHSEAVAQRQARHAAQPVVTDSLKAARELAARAVEKAEELQARLEAVEAKKAK